MVELVVCLGCGGAVDEGYGIPEGEAPCMCPPPSLEARVVMCPSCGGSLRVGARACPWCCSTLATTRCAECLAWNLAEAHHCQACGRPMIGASGEHASKSLSCPRCAGSLASRRYHELDVDECDACGGLMVSPAVMDRITSSRDSGVGLRLALPARAQERETAVRYITCPGCAKSMNRQMFGRISGVIVDVCRDHGVWFDPGELGAVLSFIERGGLTMARERERQELERARRALKAEQVTNTMGGMSQQGALFYQGSHRDQSGLLTDFLRALSDLLR